MTAVAYLQNYPLSSIIQSFIFKHKKQNSRRWVYLKESSFLLTLWFCLCSWQSILFPVIRECCRVFHFQSQSVCAVFASCSANLSFVLCNLLKDILSVTIYRSLSATLICFWSWRKPGMGGNIMHWCFLLNISQSLLPVADFLPHKRWHH